MRGACSFHRRRPVPHARRSIDRRDRPPIREFHGPDAHSSGREDGNRLKTSVPGRYGRGCTVPGLPRHSGRAMPFVSTNFGSFPGDWKAGNPATSARRAGPCPSRCSRSGDWKTSGGNGNSGPGRRQPTYPRRSSIKHCAVVSETCSIFRQASAPTCLPFITR